MHRLMPRRPGLLGATLTAATLVAVTACGAPEQTEAAPADNVAAPASDAPVTPPAESAADPSESDPATSGLSDSAEQIEPAPGATPNVPKVPKAFRFAGTTIGGEEFEGADLAGRPTVLWFWAPWCSKCVNQIDQVRALTRAYADTEVAFVGVGSLDAASAMQGFADDVGAPAMTQLSDPEGLVWRHFGTTAQSTFLVIDGDGSRIDSGYMSEADLNAAIKSGLA